MKKNIYSIILSVFLFLLPSNLYSLPVAQDPATESTIVIAADGIAPFDATTSAPTGTDENDSNGVVRNFDSITYLVEVTLNDADDTNVSAKVTLNTKGSWLSIPADCKTLANGFVVTPDSSISDTTGDGLNDTLFCNLGDHTEGTKLSFRPVAQAVGNNTDIVQASVESNSENNVNTGGVGTTQSSGPVETEITAGFGLSVGKSVLSFPPEDESDYAAKYYTVGSLVEADPDAMPPVLASEEGKVLEWHISLRYNTGSEFVADNGSGAQDFTIEDTWVGTHSNDPTVEGDNANGIFNDGVVMLGDITGVPADNCSLLGAPAGTVMCTQPGGPGSPIEIQINGVQVNQSVLALVQLNMFIPYNTVFVPNTFAAAETYDVDNTATLTGWGGGAGLPIVSATGADDTPGPASEDFIVNADRPNPGTFFDKTFSGLGNLKTGQRAATRGEIVATTIGLRNSRTSSEFIGVCDTIDTNSFEFAGAIGAGQVDGFFQGAPGYGNYNLDPNINDQPRAIHESFNPKLLAYNNTGSGATLAERVAFISDGSNEGLLVEFSSVSYSDTGDDHWTATCQDDLDGNPATTDWSTDYTDPVMFPNGAADVVRVRMTWDRNYPDLVTKFAGVSSSPLLGSLAAYSFDLRIKDDAPIGVELPNTAATLNPSNAPWDTSTADGWLGTIGSESTSNFFNAQDDPAEPLFSFNTSNNDRVFVLSASMGISKENDPIAQPPVMSGDTVSFTIDPRTAGSNASAVTMTFTDTLPSQLSYLSDDCAAIYAAAGLTCNVTVNSPTSITFDVPGYQLGDDLPPFTIQATVNPGTPAGTYTNDVVISSDFADLTDDSHCDDAVDRFGNMTADAIEDCQDTFSAPHEDSASVLIVSQSGIRVAKEDGVITTQPLANFTNTLTYENLGGNEIGIGHLIDILPYNGDGFDSTLRFNSENPSNANTATMTIDPDARAEFVSISPSSAGETFEYTTMASASLDHRPCHPSNWPLGDSLGSGNTTLDTICTLGLIDPATDLPGTSEEGTGSTIWGSIPADPADVTAIRATLPAFPSSEAQRDIVLTVNAGVTLEGDLYCNNFGLNSDVITLDIISNDVCVEVVTGSIGDYVYFDTNGDGMQDSTDIPLTGVTLALEDSMGNPIYIDPDTGAVVPADFPGAQAYTVMTDVDGNYSFDNLPTGDYVIVVDQTTLSPDLIQTADPDALFDSMSSHSLAPVLDADGNVIDVEDNTEQDFGYTGPLADLGDTVWNDINQDGINDPGEQGVSGVVVNLYDAAGNLIATTMTDTNGNYLFEDLVPGDYVVEFIPPSGYSFSPQGATGGDSDSNANPVTGVTAPITISGEDDLTVDAGIFLDDDGSGPDGPDGPIPGPGGGVFVGDAIFFDANRDGQQDSGDFVIAGVTVNLYDSNGNLVGTTVTDANGMYLFEVEPGVDYEIRLDNPNDYLLGGPLSGSSLARTDVGNDATDSDGVLLNGFPTIVFTSPTDGEDTSLDFGIVGSNGASHAAILDSLMSAGAEFVTELARALRAKCGLSNRRMNKVSVKAEALYNAAWLEIWTKMKLNSEILCDAGKMLTVYSNKPHKKLVRRNIKRLAKLASRVSEQSCEASQVDVNKATKRLDRLARKIKRRLRQVPQSVNACLESEAQ